MGNQKEVLEKLNVIKKNVVDFLDEYNQLCVRVASNLANGRYANLDLRIVQTQVKYIPDVMYGFYSAIDIKGRPQRLKDIYQKKDSIESHENDYILRSSSYLNLKTKISMLFGRDVKEDILNSKQFHKLVKKFDSYGFSPAAFVPLSHLLFFETISLVPEMYEGQHPSYLTAFRSFLGNLTYTENVLNENAPHFSFHELNYWMDRSDINLNSLNNI
jgi:hypothetical protein